MKLSGVLSTSVSASLPVAVGVPGFQHAASVTVPVVVPEMMAASLEPLIVMVINCGVPPMLVTVKVSVSVWPTFRACTALLD